MYDTQTMIAILNNLMNHVATATPTRADFGSLKICKSTVHHLQMCIYVVKRFGIKDRVGRLSNHSEALSALVKYSSKHLS